MALDEKLNGRIREVLADRKGITETKMFGGLCFMHNGNMMCGGDQKFGFMVRVGPDANEKLLKEKYAREMDFTGVPLKGFIAVAPAGVRTKVQLKKWVERGLAFTGTLPPKKKKKKAAKKKTKR